MTISEDAPGAVPPVTVTVSADGPYEVIWPVRVLAADGTVLRDGEKLFLRRCGHSGTKPYCDGSHRRVGFTDRGMGPTRRQQS